jgi:hypothetical protein
LAIQEFPLLRPWEGSKEIICFETVTQLFRLLVETCNLLMLPQGIKETFPRSAIMQVEDIPTTLPFFGGTLIGTDVVVG